MLLQFTRATRVDGKYASSVPVYINSEQVALVEQHSDPEVSWITLSVSHAEDGGEAVNFPVMGNASIVAQKIGIVP